MNLQTTSSQKCQRKATKVPSVSSDTQKTTNHSFKNLFIKFFPFLHLLTISPAMGLTSEERGELARKFKYYHKSVRPSEQFNIVDTINGTFFRLLTQMELAETRELDLKAQLSLEMSLFVHFRDDRLQLRDLQDMPIPIPQEFQPWQPRIQLFPFGTARAIQMQRMTNLSPKNGQLTVVHRYSGPLFCDFDHWRMPFERYQCQFWFETDPDERLHLTVVRDLRPNGQMVRIYFEYEQWPWLLLRFQFHSGQWQSAIVSAFLPSLLLLFCTILAQWKRRKIQVLVSLCSILALIFIQNGHQQTNIATAALSTTINLFDLWFAGIFVHLVCLLAADLLLPARRLVVFKKAYQWSEDKRHNSQQKGGAYASPAINQRKLDGIHSVRRIRATMFPATASSGSLHHHYVSSPQLGHGKQPKQRAVARLPATPSASPAQMIRTFSVPPRRLDDVRREQLEEPSPLPPLMGGSAPLSRKRTGPGGLDGMETDARERAIASLLSEMESIRRAESTSRGNNRIIRQAASSEDDEEEAFGAGPSETTPLRIAQLPPAVPPPPPPPTLPPSFGQRFHFNSHQQYGESSQAAIQSSEDELGRLEGIGMPGRKRIVLYAILMSLCLFLCTYTLLAISALYDWL